MIHREQNAAPCAAALPALLNPSISLSLTFLGRLKYSSPSSGLFTYGGMCWKTRMCFGLGSLAGAEIKALITAGGGEESVPEETFRCVNHRESRRPTVAEEALLSCASSHVSWASLSWGQAVASKNSCEFRTRQRTPPTWDNTRRKTLRWATNPSKAPQRSALREVVNMFYW